MGKGVDRGDPGFCVGVGVPVVHVGTRAVGHAPGDIASRWGGEGEREDGRLLGGTPSKSPDVRYGDPLPTRPLALNPPPTSERL